jgi:hypothetical protein
MANPKKYSGSVQYFNNRAALDDGNGTLRVLLIDNPPTGVIDSEDIAAGFRLFHEVLGVPAGGDVCVLGFSGTLGPMSYVQIVRLC